MGHVRKDTRLCTSGPNNKKELYVQASKIVPHLTPSSSLKATISSGLLKSLCTLLPSHCPRSADSLTAARTSSGRMMRASSAACRCHAVMP